MDIQNLDIVFEVLCLCIRKMNQFAPWWGLIIAVGACSDSRQARRYSNVACIGTQLYIGLCWINCPYASLPGVYGGTTWLSCLRLVSSSFALSLVASTEYCLVFPHHSPLIYYIHQQTHCIDQRLW